ncbi:ankyrin repeat-containing domain protein [Gorgonomyces haynaldii]|nr:ankyrin repeat-containing domain protein [Gorgonomyces haynaldii]
MQAAIIGKQLALCQKLLKRGEVSLEPWMESLLSVAITYSNPEIIQLLVDHGAHQECFDHAVIFDAFAKVAPVQNIKFVFGLPLSHRVTGDNFLGKAVRENGMDIIQYLVTENPLGLTHPFDDAFLLACSVQRFQVMEKLLEMGARIDGQPDSMCLPLATAARQGRLDVSFSALGAAAKTRKWETCRLLIEHDPRVVKLNCIYRKETPFHMFIDQGRKDLVQLMLHHGVDVHHRNPKGQTALQLAIIQEDYDLCVQLLDLKCSVHSKDTVGYDALLDAGFKCHAKTARLLMAHGAQILNDPPQDKPEVMEMTRNDIEWLKALDQAALDTEQSETK